jgi:hypothetical protein
MSMYPNLKEQINTKLILTILKQKGKIRRSDIYQEVLKIRLKRDNKNITYQVVCRDIQRLLDANMIKIIDGGKRSQVLSLK